MAIENGPEHEQLEGSWAEVLRALCELADDVLPSLPPAEQVLYLRLFRLSHARRSPFTTCRSEDLAVQCGLSMRTLQRALKGLKHKQLIKTVWQSHGATTFTVSFVSQVRHRPAFLPRTRASEERPPPPLAITKPPVFDAFSREDRELFLTCKRSLSPEHLNNLTDEAVD